MEPERRRLDERVAVVEGAVLSIKETQASHGALLHKIATNELHHINQDLTVLKEGMGRIERSLAGMQSDLRANSSDTNAIKLEMAKMQGEVNVKIATIEGTGKSTTGLMAWIWDILKMVLGGIIVAGMAYWAR